MNTIAMQINGTLVGKLPIKGTVTYDPTSNIFTFEDNSKAKIHCSFNFDTKELQRFWIKVS